MQFIVYFAQQVSVNKIQSFIHEQQLQMLKGLEEDTK
nr:MAG TPA: hypothetical protein [Siphoviridae sp. cta6m1]